MIDSISEVGPNTVKIFEEKSFQRENNNSDEFFSYKKLKLPINDFWSGNKVFLVELDFKNSYISSGNKPIQQFSGVLNEDFFQHKMTLYLNVYRIT